MIFRFKYFRRVVLACLLALILAIRFVPYGGEFYATCLYPSLSFGLSLVCSFIPYSCEEIIVCGFAAWLLLYPLVALLCKWKSILWGELEIVGWLIAWFYLGWGCNYFRTDFYERMMIEPAVYSDDSFSSFLQQYTDSLNASYVSAQDLDRQAAREEIKELYRQLPEGYGLTKPRFFQEPKTLLFNELYSQVGVLGYMGPFMAESQVNMELSNLEYPFVYAHELSHLLGISNEAEANFWAYTICTRSSNPVVRYSGYNGLLSYAASNAGMNLKEEDYKTWFSTLKPEVLEDERNLGAFWKSKKNPWLDKAQETLYNLFLKTNNIKDGTQNYSQVIGMLIAQRESQKEPLRRQGRSLSVKQ